MLSEVVKYEILERENEGKKMERGLRKREGLC